MTDAPGGREVQALLERARERGPTWFPDLGSQDVQATLERQHRRLRTAVCIVRLSGGRVSHLVAAKTSQPLDIIGSPSTSQAEPARPRISPVTASGELSTLWYRGLEITYRHFTALADPRFGSVRPIDLIPEIRTVVMEYLALPTLRARLMSGSRLAVRGANAPLVELVANAGAWLRQYHALAPEEELGLRCHTRDEFVSAVTGFTDYLAAGTREPDFRRLATSIERLAERHLAEQLPLGLTHGDYAPRNIFTGPGTRVTGFDAAPRFRGPVYEDLARFLAGIRTSGLQLLSLGRAYRARQLDQLEQSFLHGYAPAEQLPIRSVRVFELLVLLNRLTSMHASRQTNSMRRRVRAGVRSRFYYRRFRGEVERIMEALQ